MKLDVFRGWCQAQGIQSAVTIQEAVDGSRYTTLNPNTPSKDGFTSLVQVPLSACMIFQTQEGLADRLLYEKMRGEDSEFAPYIDVLPTSFDLPRFWSSSTIAQAPRRIQNALEEDAKRLLFADEWAQACVDTRCHVLPDGRYALTPVLDMINHRNHVVTRSSVVDDVLDLRIVTPPSSWMDALPWQAPSEVFISYNENMTNIDTMLQYGFVDVENPSNTEVLKVRGSELEIHADGSLQGIEAVQKDLSDQMKLEGAALDEEVYALVAAELLQQVDASATTSDNRLLQEYAQGRIRTLQTAFDGIQKRFPHLELV